jgi:ribonuclease T1
VFLSGPPLAWDVLRKLGLAITVTGVLIAAGATPAGAFAKDPVPFLATVTLAELPQEARATRELIRSGGPFPYLKDGGVFGNREQLLTARPRGYYREYTVQTFGSADRGARRIVCGGRERRVPETCYYSNDHYASYRRIVP